MIWNRYELNTTAPDLLAMTRAAGLPARSAHVWEHLRSVRGQNAAAAALAANPGPTFTPPRVQRIAGTPADMLCDPQYR